MPTPITDGDDDALDISPRGIQRRLDKVNEILERANTRLDVIRASFAEPPTPDMPAMLTTLTAVQAQAAHAARVAEGLIALLTTRA